MKHFCSLPGDGGRDSGGARRAEPPKRHVIAMLIVDNLAIECLAGWWLGWLAHRRSRAGRRYS